MQFAGFDMPIQFEGIKAEHKAVREAAGLFDVSHMGEIWLEGKDALAQVKREVKAAAEAHALGLLDVRAAAGPMLPDQTLADRVAAFEAREIAPALDRHRGNTVRTAEALGLPRRTLNDKMRRYGLLS